MRKSISTILIILCVLPIASCGEIKASLEEQRLDREMRKPTGAPTLRGYHYTEIGGHYYRFLYGTGRQTVKFLESDGFSPVVTQQIFVSWNLSDESNLEVRADSFVRFPWVRWQPELSFTDETHPRYYSKFPKMGEHFHAIPDDISGMFLVSAEPLYFDRHAIIKCDVRNFPHGREPKPGEEVLYSLRDCSGSFQKYLPADKPSEDAFPPHVSFSNLTLGPFRPEGSIHGPSRNSDEGYNREIYFRSSRDPAFYKDLEKALGYFEEIIRKSYVGTEIPADENNINYPLLGEE